MEMNDVDELPDPLEVASRQPRTGAIVTVEFEEGQKNKYIGQITNNQILLGYYTHS